MYQVHLPSGNTLPACLPPVAPGWGLSSRFLLLILLCWGGLLISPELQAFWQPPVDAARGSPVAGESGLVPRSGPAINNNNKKAVTFINQLQLALFTPHFQAVLGLHRPSRLSWPCRRPEASEKPPRQREKRRGGILSAGVITLFGYKKCLL